MSIVIKRANISNILEMQHVNMMCLPENYTMKYYLYHLLTWPELSFVAFDEKNKLVGYVMGKLDDEDELSINDPLLNGKSVFGHITSLAVKLSHRKLGIAKSLMDYVERQMSIIYNVTHITLHVRVGNSGALHLYKNSLKFKVKSTESKYYGDGEDAYFMIKTLDKTKYIEFLETKFQQAKNLHQKLKEIYITDCLTKIAI